MAIFDQSTGPTSSPSISFAGATPASPSLTRERVRASLIRATSGQRLPDAFATYAPDSCCWKTSQGTFPWDSGTYSETWPRSGMMRGGIASRLPPSAPRTYATACSLWRGGMMPTPVAQDAKNATLPPSQGKRDSLPGYLIRSRQAVRLLHTPVANDAKKTTLPPSEGKRTSLVGDLIRSGHSGRLSPRFVEWMMGYPLGWTAPACED